MGQLISVKYLFMDRSENSEFSCLYCFVSTEAHYSNSRPYSLGLVSLLYVHILDTSFAKLPPIRLGQMTSLSLVGLPPAAKGIFKSLHEFYNNFK